MRNRHPGRCYRCGMTVMVGAGHFERHDSPGGKWRVQHADCATRWRGKPAPTMAEARAAHEHPKYMRREQQAAMGAGGQ